MSPDRFWIVLVDVLPDAPDNADWLRSFGDSAGGGFVHVIGLAPNTESFQQAIRDDLATHGWVASTFSDLELLSDLKSREPLSPAFEEMEKEVVRTGELQFGRFFLYPLEDVVTTDWLAQESQDRRLSLTQSTLLSNLSRMLRHLTLTQLDQGMGLTGQGSDILEVHLPHRNAGELDLTILARRDEDITIDYEYGHVHFNASVGADWISQALEFIYGALQGGVKVEIWATGDKLERSRALILLENGDWHPFLAWSATPDPMAGDSPTIVKVLSFV
ncbi:MAG TPA: hypothetical protein VHI31_01350 [Actinomycetota bacterium]|nr:hypothetical protein [Actinomycetota bacterium]